MSQNQRPFQRPTRLEEVYRREINRLLETYFSIPTTDTLGQITARLVEFGQAERFLQRFAMTQAKRMITQVRQYNAISWRQAATKSSNGKLIYRMLKRELDGPLGVHVDFLIRQNAELIKSVPVNVAEILSRHIQVRQIEGVRSEQIVKEIRKKLPDLMEFQIRRIARTEVAKADTAITRVRAQSIGLNWYQWETSEDQRVRKSHRKMDRVLVNWDDTPSPELLAGEPSQGHYNAGNIYNCRCVALPIVRMDEITFPVRVYSGGKIKRLTRHQFLLLSGGQSRLAA